MKQIELEKNNNNCNKIRSFKNNEGTILVTGATGTDSNEVVN